MYIYICMYIYIYICIDGFYILHYPLKHHIGQVRGPDSIVYNVFSTCFSLGTPRFHTNPSIHESLVKPLFNSWWNHMKSPFGWVNRHFLGWTKRNDQHQWFFGPTEGEPLPSPPSSIGGARWAKTGKLCSAYCLRWRAFGKHKISRSGTLGHSMPYEKGRVPI